MRKQQAAFEETIYEENWQGVSQILGESLTKPKLGMAGKSIPVFAQKIHITGVL